MRHLYSCRSYMYVRLYAIKLFMRAYRHFVGRSVELLNQSRSSDTILKLMMISTADPSNWLVFLFLPWDMRCLRVPCPSALPHPEQDITTKSSTSPTSPQETRSSPAESTSPSPSATTSPDSNCGYTNSSLSSATMNTWSCHPLA